MAGTRKRVRRHAPEQPRLAAVRVDDVGTKLRDRPLDLQVTLRVAHGR